MKLTFAVVGAGRQGLCAAHDISTLNGVGNVILADRDPARLEAAVARLSHLAPHIEIEAREVNGGDPGALKLAIRGAQAVVSSVPYVFGYSVCEAAVAQGAHVVDLGGNFEVSQKIAGLAGAAAKNHCIVAPDCGLMPGLGNTLAGFAIKQLEEGGGRELSVEVRCGGLPAKPRNALGYELVFSFDGLINEYDGASVVLRNGRIAEDPTLADIQEYMHPRLGPLETATTSGGTSGAPVSFAGRAKDYTYKTVRYPGHFQFFHMLKKLGLFTPAHRPALRALLDPVLNTTDPDDLVFLRVDARASSGESCSRELIDFRDPATGFTAMERMTAMPAVAVLELAVEGRLSPGAVRVECDLPTEDYLQRLSRRGILHS